MDSGELKQVAVEFTRKFGAAALLTSVYDSDSFEFVMFHAGKQVDAAVSDSEGHTGGLRMLKGKRRAQAWYSTFIGRDLPRAGAASKTGKLLAGWEERLKTPPRSTTPFAEDELAAWCTLAGLAPENAIQNFAQAVALDGRPGVTTLAFERASIKTKAAAVEPTRAIFAYYRSDDDCPYHTSTRRPGRWALAFPAKCNGPLSATGESRACACASMSKGRRRCTCVAYQFGRCRSITGRSLR